MNTVRSPKASQRGNNANNFFILPSIHLNVFMMSELEVSKNKKEVKRVGDWKGHNSLWLSS